MEQNKPLSHVAAGLLIAAIVIVISLITMMVTRNPSNTSGGWISYLVIIGGLILFIHLYARAKDHYVTFGELFSYGFKATAVYTILFIVFLLLISLLMPGFKNDAIEAARTAMENQSGYNEERAEQALAMMDKYFWVFAIGGTMLAFIVVGAIGSLLGAALAKKRPKNPFEQQLP